MNENNMFKEIVSKANVYDQKKHAQELVEALRYEHRTIQQCFWRTILIAMNEYAKANFDLRNEASVKWCQDIAKNPPGLPYI